MCGINGIFEKGSSTDLQGAILGMNGSIRHRGPDDSGFSIRKTPHGVLAFGQVRLSIIDLSEAGHQPMSYEKTKGASSARFRNGAEEKLEIVFNGEIYNYIALREELVREGYVFSTRCDTEVILAAYDAWGSKCVEKFEGFWAFALYDEQAKTVFCSRDRFGKKPFHYRETPNGFAFSSEIKSLLTLGGQKRIDKESLGYYLTYGYVPSPLSIFEGIRKLSPGSNLFLDITTGIIRIESYYEIKAKAQNGFSFEENQKLVIQKLESAVERRLVGDVPIGTFLSGGIDSSLVSLITKKKFAHKELHTFSIGFDIPTYDETQYAKAVANEIGSVHHAHRIGEREAFEILNELPNFYDEPFADSSMIPTFAVSKLAKKYVTVALSGDGADELFGGYLNFALFHYLRTVRTLVPIGMGGIAGKIAGGISGLIHPAFDHKGAALGLKSLEFLRYRKDYQLFAQISSLFAYREPKNFEIFRKYFEGSGNWKDGAMASLTGTHLIDDFFVKVDRASMAHALEVRSPFVDHDLAEFALTIPADQKIRIFNGYRYKLKHVLKEAGKEYLPKVIYERGKQGFGAPVAEYFNGPWMNFLQEKLRMLVERDMLPMSKKEIDKILEDHRVGKYDYFSFLYALLYLELWMERWMD